VLVDEPDVALLYVLTNYDFPRFQLHHMTAMLESDEITLKKQKRTKSGLEQCSAYCCAEKRNKYAPLISEIQLL
jgi:hypothetical protein